MSGTDKIFGLILFLAGVSIAAYYTVWQFLSLVSLIQISHPSFTAGPLKIARDL